MTEMYIRTTGRCPVCEEVGSLDYLEIPPSTRVYEKNGETFTDSFPESRDFGCRNCGAEWNLSFEGNL